MPGGRSCGRGGERVNAITLLELGSAGIFLAGIAHGTAIKERVGAGQETGPAAPETARGREVNYPPNPGWGKGNGEGRESPGPSG